VTFDFDNGKNELLYRKRGVTFQIVISSIADHGVLADFAHPNQQKYPKQRVLVVEIDGYILCTICGSWIYLVLEDNLSK
jgi:uncharacterized DUF497 family protein